MRGNGTRSGSARCSARAMPAREMYKARSSIFTASRPPCRSRCRASSAAHRTTSRGRQARPRHGRLLPAGQSARAAGHSGAAARGGPAGQLSLHGRRTRRAAAPLRGCRAAGRPLVHGQHLRQPGADGAHRPGGAGRARVDPALLHALGRELADAVVAPGPVARPSMTAKAAPTPTPTPTPAPAPAPAPSPQADRAQSVTGQHLVPRVAPVARRHRRPLAPWPDSAGAGLARHRAGRLPGMASGAARGAITVVRRRWTATPHLFLLIAFTRPAPPLDSACTPP